MTYLITMIATAVVVAAFVGPACIVAGYILGAWDHRGEDGEPDLESYTMGYEAGRREGWYSGWEAAVGVKARRGEGRERARCN
jgi:hypothetical protein